MPSEKVVRILLSMTDLSPGEIDRLPETEAWKLVYAAKPEQKPVRRSTPSMATP